MRTSTVQGFEVSPKARHGLIDADQIAVVSARDILPSPAMHVSGDRFAEMGVLIFVVVISLNSETTATDFFAKLSTSGLQFCQRFLSRQKMRGAASGDAAISWRSVVRFESLVKMAASKLDVSFTPERNHLSSR